MTDVQTFELLQALGGIMVATGVLLAAACDGLVARRFPGAAAAAARSIDGSVAAVLSRSRCHKVSLWLTDK